jgi:catechol 2,3-dioxygenase-like lactoylglutathione lyase family enzyme
MAGRHVFFRAGGQMLLVFNPEETKKPAAPGAVLAVPTHGAIGPGHICFAAPGGAFDTWRAHLAEHGVAIEAEVTWPGGGRSIYFRDPAGNSLEFAEPKIWGLG